MKIIDILNKIAKGEEVPIVKYEDRILKYNELHEWFDDINDDSRCKMEFYPSELNDEVEIIEEEKEIEFENIIELEIPEIDTIENERICRAEYRINALIKNQKKIIDVINDMRDRDENND